MANHVPTPEIRPYVAALHGEIRTTSLKVAAHFGKQHRDVLRRVKSLECSEEFNQRNFALVAYKDAKGEDRPLVDMTKDGFMLLAMGFTGPAALRIKEAYIGEFNRMEAALRQPKVRVKDLLEQPRSLPAPVRSRLLLTLEDGQVVASEAVPEDAEVCSRYEFKARVALGGYRLVSLRNWVDICEVLGAVEDKQLPAIERWLRARQHGRAT